jgi:hypothetical protein
MPTVTLDPDQSGPSDELVPNRLHPNHPTRNRLITEAAGQPTKWYVEKWFRDIQSQNQRDGTPSRARLATPSVDTQGLHLNQLQTQKSRLVQYRLQALGAAQRRRLGRLGTCQVFRLPIGLRLNHRQIVCLLPNIPNKLSRPEQVMSSRISYVSRIDRLETERGADEEMGVLEQALGWGKNHSIRRSRVRGLIQCLGRYAKTEAAKMRFAISAYDVSSCMLVHLTWFYVRSFK